MRFVPSLIVTEEEIHKCVDIIESCLSIMDKEIGTVH